jgi:DNA-binding SARP family transcriptional activator
MLSVSLLGDFGIRHDLAPVTDVNTPRLQSLLAYLLLHKDAPQSRARLAFLFWPDTTEAQARTNLRNLLHHLRRALPDAGSYLDTSAQTVQWRPGALVTLDVTDFCAALAQAEQPSQGRERTAVQEALERAVGLYKGDLLPSCYDDWILLPRETLRQAYLNALERLARMLEEQRDYRAAINYAQRMLQHDPLHEATYRNLIRLHAFDDNRADALRVYHTCATVLQRELDVGPSAATRRVYEQLLGAESRPSKPVPATTAYSPLVGREVEWAEMLRAWRTAAAGGEPHVLMLCGEAGIGKSRLVEELLQWADRQGLAIASARCYAAEGELAYAPVIAWLRARPLVPLDDASLAEVARLLPETLARRPDLPQPGPLTEAWQRERLFEALSLAFVGTNQPLLLAVDDLQWCDRDTLEWLHFLLRFEREARLLVVGAYRPEEIGEGHPLRSSLQALRLEGQVTEIDLGPLDEAGTQTLASQIAGLRISQGTAQRVYRETEGNPLFVVETMRAGLPVHGQELDRGMPRGASADPSAPGVGLPPRVRSVLEARLAQVSPPSRDLIQLAATIGREFSFRLLAEAAGQDEEPLVRQLDELWQRRIVREHGTHAYDFSHDKLREVAYASMSAARRRLLHRHVAQALEALHAAELGPVSYQVAVHYERAGLPEQAAPHYLRAAQVARQVYANEEAIALLRRGLELVAEYRPGTGGREAGHEISVHLWEELGDLLELRAQHEEARQAYQNARARVHQRDRVAQARLHRKAGGTLREQRLYAEQLEACRQAEEALGQQPEDGSAPWLEEWLEVQVERVWAYYWLAQWPEMAELVHKLHPAVQKSGRGASRIRFLLASCLMHLRHERYAISDETLADSREALTLSREWGDLKTRMDCQFELAFLHLWRRDLDEADKHLRATLELAETSGAAWMRTLSLTYLTVLSRFRGQTGGVLDHARRAQEAAETAHMPDYVAAAKGNQAWLAWRRRDLHAAEQSCQEALAIWQQSPLVYPFQWQALWPLIAVKLARGRAEEVWAHVQALLEPEQQLLPDELNTTLEAAAHAQVEGQTREACRHLERAMHLAREMGYL